MSDEETTVVDEIEEETVLDEDVSEEANLDQEDESDTDENREDHPDGWQKRVNRLTGKVKERDEEIARLNLELESQGEVFEQNRLDAANAMHVHPKFITPDEVKVLSEAQAEESYVLGLEDALDEAVEEGSFTDNKDRKWSARELRGKLRAVKKESGGLIRRAEQISTRALAEQEKALSGVRPAKVSLGKPAAKKPPRVPSGSGQSAGDPASVGTRKRSAMDHRKIRDSKDPKDELQRQIMRRRGVAVD